VHSKVFPTVYIDVLFLIISVSPCWDGWALMDQCLSAFTRT